MGTLRLRLILVWMCSLHSQSSYSKTPGCGFFHLNRTSYETVLLSQSFCQKFSPGPDNSLPLEFSQLTYVCKFFDVVRWKMYVLFGACEWTVTDVPKGFVCVKFLGTISLLVVPSLICLDMPGGLLYTAFPNMSMENRFLTYCTVLCNLK